LREIVRDDEGHIAVLHQLYLRVGWLGVRRLLSVFSLDHSFFELFFGDPGSAKGTGPRAVVMYSGSASTQSTQVMTS
jgi:hypothetical protein